MCSGTRPWLNDEKEDCAERLYALQRGASNIYFSIMRSALSIPPWSDPLQAEVASYHKLFAGQLTEDALKQVIQSLFSQHPIERVMECIARLSKLTTEKPSIRREEYQLLDADQDHIYIYFEARKQAMLPRTQKFFSGMLSIPRLREVRTLIGFSRIEAPEMDPTMEVFNEEQGVPITPAPISAKQLDWLPAVENLGEGVFLRLNAKRLENWENFESEQSTERLFGMAAKARIAGSQGSTSSVDSPAHSSAHAHAADVTGLRVFLGLSA
jgi:hypothetical protein